MRRLFRTPSDHRAQTNIQKLPMLVLLSCCSPWFPLRLSPRCVVSITMVNAYRNRLDENISKKFRPKKTARRRLSVRVPAQAPSSHGHHPNRCKNSNTDHPKGYKRDHLGTSSNDGSGSGKPSVLPKRPSPLSVLGNSRTMPKIGVSWA